MKIVHVVLVSSLLMCSDNKPVNPIPAPFPLTSAMLESAGDWVSNLKYSSTTTLHFKGSKAQLSFHPARLEVIGEYQILGPRTFKIDMKSVSHGNPEEISSLKHIYMCSFHDEPHPFQYQRSLLCKSESRCTPAFVACEYLSNLRVFDTFSSDKSEKEVEVDGHRLISRGLVDGLLKAPAFLRTRPDTKAPAIKFEGCGIPNEEGRYPQGSTFTAIGRQLKPTPVQHWNDYWYYGYAYESNCVDGTLHKIWVYGALLDFSSQ